MNTDALINALRELAPKATDHFSLARYNPESVEYRLAKERSVAPGPVVNKLTRTLESQPELQVFKLPLRTSPSSGSGSGIPMNHVAHWLLAQARLYDASIVVQRLEQFLATNAVDALEIIPISGLHPRVEVTITSNIALVPFTALPPSVPKDRLTGLSSARWPDNNSFVWSPRPTAALVRRFVHSPVFNPTGNDDRQWREHFRTANEYQAEHMREIARLLTIIRPSAVFPIAHWFQLLEHWPLVGPVGGWGSYAYYRGYMEAIEPEDYDSDEIQRLVGNYFKLQPIVRSRLSLTLQRLALALIRDSPEDSALDLGIALESLLTHDQDSEAPISYKLRLRATHLLGGDPQHRQTVANRFRSLYVLRSKVAHGTTLDDYKLPKEFSAESVTEFLQKCAADTATMIRKIIDIGEFPDWEGLAMGWATLL